jgi:L-asparaginase
MIFATGGTIAGRGSSSTASGVYQAGSIGVGALVDAVPELLNVSNIYGVQIANVGSPSINSTIQLNMAQYANKVLCAEDSIFDSLVITHGTDTLEETAFFMDLTVNCRKPVIIVGAMRPATALSADGPANLYAAVKTGVFPDSKDRGALIVMNDRIGSAFYTQKTHVNYLDTFKAPEPGYLGGLFNNEPFYYYSPATPKYKNTFDVTNVTSLPKVDIVYGHQETDPRIFESIVKYGDVKGIVLASPNGGVGVDSAITDAISSGIPIVRHVRINVGMIAPSETPRNGSVISSGLINNQKSRIQLQLALATGADPRAVFEDALREELYGN